MTLKLYQFLIMMLIGIHISMHIECLSFYVYTDVWVAYMCVIIDEDCSKATSQTFVVFDLFSDFLFFATGQLASASK